MEYKPTPYQTKTWLLYALIQQAIAENWLDTLCYFVWLKSAYKKPVFYNYSLRRVASKIGCSPATLRHHLNILSKHGLITIQGSTLLIKSNNAMRAEDALMVPVGISHNKADQRTLLRFATLKRNFKNQHTVFQEKNDALRYHQQRVTNATDYKRCKRLAQKHTDTVESSMQDCFTLGNKKIGKFTNRSQATGLKIQKAFNSLGLIVSYKRTKLVSDTKTSRKCFYSAEHGSDHFLSSKGYVFRRLTNGMVLGDIVVCR